MIVIAITSIIAVTVAVFIQKPVQGYFDTVRRAELTDIADTALRRLGRDLRLALPNSVRTTGSGAVAYMEFLQTSGGGRYRASPDNTGGGNVLDFTQANTKFDVLGPAVATVRRGDETMTHRRDEERHAPPNAPTRGSGGG